MIAVFGFSENSLEEPVDIAGRDFQDFLCFLLGLRKVCVAVSQCRQRWSCNCLGRILTAANRSQYDVIYEYVLFINYVVDVVVDRR